MTMRGSRMVIYSILLIVLMRTRPDRKSTRLNSSHSQISYAVFCLKKKKQFDAASARLECVEWARSPTGIAVLADTYARAELATFARHEACAADIVVGLALRATVRE